MSKRNLQRSQTKKEKKAQIIKINTFLGEITVENSKFNRVVQELIDAANEGKFSCRIMLTKELLERLSTERRSENNGKLIVKKPLRCKKIINSSENSKNSFQSEYEVSWDHACSEQNQLRLDEVSFDDMQRDKDFDKKLMEFIKNNLVEFLYVSTCKAKTRDIVEKGDSGRDIDD